MKKVFTWIELLVFIGIIVGLAMVGAGIYAGAKKNGIKQTRTEAVKMGVARWTVVDEKGGTEFRWNSPLAPSGCPVSKDGYLSLLYATNEFGVLDVRWMPPSRTESVVPKVSDVSTNGYILRLQDATTGKEIEVLIPVYSNVTQLLLSDLSGTRYLSEINSRTTNGHRK